MVAAAVLVLGGGGAAGAVALRGPLVCVPLQALTGPSGKNHRPININHYATKKTAAQSMLDVALLMANSSQLKTALHVGPQYRFYTPLVALLSVSIALQVVVGLLLIFIGESSSRLQPSGRLLHLRLCRQSNTT